MLFRSTDITQPNIRFQQTKSLPPEMTRTDSAAVKYHKDKNEGIYKPIVDKNKRHAERKWSLKKLRSREDPLVLFTLISQGVIGAFMLLFLGALAGIEPLVTATQSSAYLPMLFIMLAMESFALFISTMHLGKPHRFYRAFNNLKYSPVSREVAGVAVFFNSLLAHTFFSLFDMAIMQTLATVFACAAVITGPIALYFMHKIYRIEARPFWNHHQVLTAFYGNMFTMGALLTGLVFVPVFLYQGISVVALLTVLALCLMIGLIIEGLGHISHTHYLKTRGREGAVSYYELITTFGKTYITRNILLAVNIMVATGLFFSASESLVSLSVWVLLAISIIISALVSRALFYVLVVPTTMPGAFFWKNKGFEEHARESGLANMPQVGVIADTH